MQVINMYQAKTQLSALVDTVLNGGEVVIAKFGKPLVRLTPFVPALDRTFGALKGNTKIPQDFDVESAEVNQLFYQSDND
jgi:antitoxin (DNA-binding transcriptional repressor) of toxin-antitoxin stability system